MLLEGKSGGKSLGSMLNKAVHIATLAPSPPRSPWGVRGKGGKKQNYQTNNNFPFSYTPLPPILTEIRSLLVSVGRSRTVALFPE